MTARYVLSHQARQVLRDIAEYIANDTGLAQAERVVRELQRNFVLLGNRRMKTAEGIEVWPIAALHKALANGSLSI